MSFVIRATCSTMMRDFLGHVRGAKRAACHLPGARLDDVEGRSELVREAGGEPSDGGEAVGVPELRERAHLRVGLRRARSRARRGDARTSGSSRGRAPRSRRGGE